MTTSTAFVLSTLIPLALAIPGERFACNANTLSAPERARHEELSRRLFAAVDEQRELADGYAFRMTADNLVRAAEWVSLERRCCPFFTFGLEQSRNGGPVWLRVTGPEGVKAFIREELGL